MWSKTIQWEEWVLAGWFQPWQRGKGEAQDNHLDFITSTHFFSSFHQRVIRMSEGEKERKQAREIWEWNQRNIGRVRDTRSKEMDWRDIRNWARDTWEMNKRSIGFIEDKDEATFHMTKEWLVFFVSLFSLFLPDCILLLSPPPTLFSLIPYWKTGITQKKRRRERRWRSTFLSLLFLSLSNSVCRVVLMQVHLRGEGKLRKERTSSSSSSSW